jgi:hypothetical protein
VLGCSFYEIVLVDTFPLVRRAPKSCHAVPSWFSPAKCFRSYLDLRPTIPLQPVLMGYDGHFLGYDLSLAL